MSSWKDLERGVPDIGRAGRRLLEDGDGRRRDDESFFVAGDAQPVADPAIRAAVATRMPYDDDVDDHGLCEFGVDRALRTTWATPTSPTYRRWQKGD